jgi:hypothetical protein
MSRTRRTDLPETTWAPSALCADMPAEIFEAAGDRVQTAKAACAHCPVTRPCLRWAVSHEVEEEIWGARTPPERRRLSLAFLLDPPAAVMDTPRAPIQAAPVPVPSTSGGRRRNQSGTAAAGRAKKATPGVREPRTRTKAPAECGTEAGYKRHRRLGEETCADCRRAVREAQEDRAARHAAGVPLATRAKVAHCGTPAGYGRHRSRGEDPCDRCRKANSDYLQAYRAASQSAAS